MRRSVRCEPGRMHPGPIQTTRHVTDASRVTRLGGRARRTGTVASRQENFPPTRNADVSLTPLYAPVVGRRRRCHHRPHGVPRVRRHHQARRRQRRARFLRKCPSRRSPSRRARVRPRTVDPASASNLDANSNSLVGPVFRDTSASGRGASSRASWVRTDLFHEALFQPARRKPENDDSPLSPPLLE